MSKMKRRQKERAEEKNYYKFVSLELSVYLDTRKCVYSHLIKKERKNQ